MAVIMIDSSAVASAHNAMSAEYDENRDLWYSHLFTEIHEFILGSVGPGPGRKALDVGCGTGLQSLLLSEAGYETHGFDLAEDLLLLARNKAERMIHENRGLDGEKYPHRHTEAARALRGEAGWIVPDFWCGDATHPGNYSKGPYDVVVCCGSVLSFIEDHEKVLRFIEGALKPGGIAILEVEQKFNLDLIWPIIDRILGGRLGYEQNWSRALGNLLTFPRRNLRVDFPFHLAGGEIVNLPLLLFSTSYLQGVFDRLGLVRMDSRGIHVLTNLIPSTVLHERMPGRILHGAFKGLSALDRSLSRMWPLRGLGCSVIYALEKRSRC